MELPCVATQWMCLGIRVQSFVPHMQMQRRMALVNERRKSAGLPHCELGVGVYTGEVLHGFIGAEDCLEYTVIGDTVNTGARLCSVAKAGEVIISQSTYEALGDEFDVIALPDVRVKNKSEPLKIYNVVGDRRFGYGSDRTRPA